MEVELEESRDGDLGGDLEAGGLTKRGKSTIAWYPFQPGLGWVLHQFSLDWGGCCINSAWTGVGAASIQPGLGWVLHQLSLDWGGCCINSAWTGMGAALIHHRLGWVLH